MSGIIASLFKKKSIREAAEKSITLSQSKPHSFTETNLIRKLRNENERLQLLNKKQEQTITFLTSKIKEAEESISPNDFELISDLEANIEKTKNEIQQLKERYKTLSRQSQKNSMVIADLRGENSTQLTLLRTEKMKFKRNPEIFLSQKENQLVKKHKKLELLKNEANRQSDIESIFQKTETDYNNYQNQLKQLKEKEIFLEKIKTEEANLEDRLAQLKRASDLQRNLVVLQNYNNEQDKVTKSLQLIASFASRSSQSFQNLSQNPNSN